MAPLPIPSPQLTALTISTPPSTSEPSPSSPAQTTPPAPNINKPLLPTHLTILLTILCTLVFLALAITLYTLYQRHLYRGFARYYIWKTERPPHPEGRWREVPRVNRGNARFYGPGIGRGREEVEIEMRKAGDGDRVEMKSLGMSAKEQGEKFRCEDVKVNLKVPRGAYGGWRGVR